MAIRQDFYSTDFEDMGDYSGRSLFRNRFNNLQDFENYAAPSPNLMPALAPALAPATASAPVATPAPALASAQGTSKQNIIDSLTKQIQGSSDTSKWSGGYAADAAAKDMARILADTGITDISQFGPVTKEVELYMGEGVDGTPIYQKQLEQSFGNKLTGQAVPVTYSERQTGNAFGGTFEGKGNTGYRVNFNPDGTPVFYTTGASSSNAGEIIKPFAQMALLAAGIGGLEALGLGAGAGGAAAGGAGAAGMTAAELAQLDLTLGGIGGSTGATTLGNALMTGATVPTITSLTGGSGLLTGAAAGITPESVAAKLAEGTGSTIIAPPPAPSAIIEPVASIQPSPVSSGTGITANNSGLGINAGSTGLNTIAVEGGLTNTGILTGSPLGTELLGTGLGAAGLTGTGILAGSELGTGLLGTTSTTPLVGTGVLSGSTLGTELLGTGANTAATVGGVTGLTNAANVGYGALNTGVSTGLTGLGSGAVDTGINPSGASTTGIDPTTVTTPATPAASTNPLSSLTPSQLANILKGVVGLFGAAGAGRALSGGGGGSSMGVGALPTQGVPLNSQDYFNAIQQNYNTLMPAMPKDVATPLANWYNSQYGA